MSRSVTLRHNFETAHRLPHLGGKCANLHGHSWWTEVTVSAPLLAENLTVVEFAGFKRAMRTWIDGHLDHGAILSVHDPLTEMLRTTGSRVYIFGEDWKGALWPTVEAVAELIAEQARDWLGTLDGMLAPEASVTRVRVTETAVNSAQWDAG